MSGGEPKTRKQLRTFGLAFGGGLSVLGGVLYWRGLAAAPWVWGVAATVLLLGLAAPRALAPLERLMAAIFRAVTAAITWVVLTLFFFLVLTPIALVIRLTGRDLLHRRLDKGLDSYWIEVPPDGPWSRPEKPF